ncbi:transmembrane protein, putative (macronuclear) [Tetrahymena thermophila SB210]|uniref:Transmembrane protein, putative n=1 Tax=Tetrahymena thermophila (strain SB210) TaxID=312017 RepID=W7WY94_TETTS|nr:transmembrane protein, putative [Tetrahymena thermophila SB210]EWS71820.1 transmembrane protein, putative [Tetrahymena thermophila SB210]|eukprot:XP_012655642.1 transmembrane protein, putative [Tetrahymena thermophila SB210]
MLSKKYAIYLRVVRIICHIQLISIKISETFQMLTFIYMSLISVQIEKQSLLQQIRLLSITSTYVSTNIILKTQFFNFFFSLLKIFKRYFFFKLELSRLRKNRLKQLNLSFKKIIENYIDSF